MKSIYVYISPPLPLDLYLLVIFSLSQEVRKLVRKQFMSIALMQKVFHVQQEERRSASGARNNTNVQNTTR
jgi:hypothetical protein